MPIILGFLAGVGLPIQTSVNTRLRKKVGSPFNAALVSFLVGLLFLSALLLVTGQGLHIPFAQLLNEPAWIWIGGICGVMFLTGNILLFPKLGGVQTVVLPVLGQILMGLTIDNFGLFYSQQTSLTASHCRCSAGATRRGFGLDGERKQGGPHQSTKISTGLFVALESVFRF